jgi:hypothetical protein
MMFGFDVGFDVYEMCSKENLEYQRDGQYQNNNMKIHPTRREGEAACNYGPYVGFNKQKYDRFYFSVFNLSYLDIDAFAVEETATYQNVKYGYSISYPSDLLQPLGESENGDGQTFQGENARLLVWGSLSPKVLEETLESMFNQQVNNSSREVTYKVLHEDWFAISGYEEGQIFYQKTFIKDGVEYSFLLTYSQQVRDTFDDVVSVLVDSFIVPETEVFSDATANKDDLFDGKIDYEVNNSLCAAFDAPKCLAVTSSDGFEYINSVVDSYSSRSRKLDNASYVYEVGVFATIVSKADDGTSMIVFLSN